MDGRPIATMARALARVAAFAICVAVATACAGSEDDGARAGAQAQTATNCAQQMVQGNDPGPMCGGLSAEQIQAAQALIVHNAGREFRARVGNNPTRATVVSATYIFCLPPDAWTGVAAGPVTQTLRSRAGAQYACRAIGADGFVGALTHLAVDDPTNQLFDAVVLDSGLPDAFRRALQGTRGVDAATTWRLAVGCARSGNAQCAQAVSRAVTSELTRPSMDTGHPPADLAAALLRYDPTGSPELSGFYRDVIEGCVELPRGESDAAYDARFLEWLGRFESDPTTNCVRHLGPVGSLLVGLWNGLATDLAIRLRALSMLMDGSNGLSGPERLAALVLFISPSFGHANEACRNGANGGTTWAQCAVGIGITTLDVTLTVESVGRLAAAAEQLAGRIGGGAVAGAREATATLLEQTSRLARRFELSGPAWQPLTTRGLDMWTQLADDVARAGGGARIVIDDSAGVLDPAIRAQFSGAASGANDIRIAILRDGGNGFVVPFEHTTKGLVTDMPLDAGLFDEGTGTIYLGPQADRFALDHELFHYDDLLRDGFWKTGRSPSEAWINAAEQRAYQFTADQIGQVLAQGSTPPELVVDLLKRMMAAGNVSDMFRRALSGRWGP